MITADESTVTAVGRRHTFKLYCYFSQIATQSASHLIGSATIGAFHCVGIPNLQPVCGEWSHLPLSSKTCHRFTLLISFPPLCAIFLVTINFREHSFDWLSEKYRVCSFFDSQKCCTFVKLMLKIVPTFAVSPSFLEYVGIAVRH